MLDPADELEDKIMYQINSSLIKSHNREKIGAWVRVMVYSILGLILTTFLVLPSNSLNIPVKIKSFFTIQWIQELDLGILSFNSIQSYLVMTVMIFAASIWLIILFNHPKKEIVKNSL